MFNHTLSLKYGGGAGVGSATRNLRHGLEKAGVAVREIGSEHAGNRFVREQMDLLTQSPGSNLIFPNYYLPPLGASKCRKIVVIHDVLYKDIPESTSSKKTAWLNFNFTYLLRRADTLSFISQFSRDRFLQYFPWAKSRQTVVIPNSIDENAFNLRPRQHSRTAGKFNITTVSAHYPHKNFETILSVATLLGNDYTFSIIGRAPSAEEMLALLKRAGLDRPPANVHFTGFLSEDSMIDRIGSSDLFLFPSSYEGFGMPPVEAVALGVPVIASLLPPIEETLGGLCTFVDNPRDPAEWIHNIRSIEKTPPTSAAMARASAAVIERYSRPAIGSLAARELGL
jgi:glycosyltransferase involved in cell wall biosynthesis